MLVFLRKKHRNSQKWATFMNFSFWPSLCKGIAKGGVKSCKKGGSKRLFAFVHVCSRLLAFACVFASAFACVCPRLSAFACVCSHLLTPPFVAPPLCVTLTLVWFARATPDVGLFLGLFGHLGPEGPGDSLFDLFLTLLGFRAREGPNLVS